MTLQFDLHSQTTHQSIHKILIHIHTYLYTQKQIKDIYIYIYMKYVPLEALNHLHQQQAQEVSSPPYPLEQNQVKNFSSSCCCLLFGLSPCFPYLYKDKLQSHL